MKTSDFDYFLPEELIAQEPLEQRSSSRLLTLIEGKIDHRHFYNITEYLKKGDCLVLNNTRVLPARLYGTKKDTGAAIEFLLLKRIDLCCWEVILKPGRRAKKGAKFVFGDILEAEILEVLENGNRIVKFTFEGVFEEILDRLDREMLRTALLYPGVREMIEQTADQTLPLYGKLEKVYESLA